jgi:16S rRNA (cytidine1402-2'-O)-methyltransferase
MGTLYLVATPIGNREDITHRAVRVLGEVALIAAEDTRRTGLLLRHFGITTPLISYHAHNESARRPTLLAHLDRADLALVSDAGTPGLSDPGYDLITAAIAAGHAIVPVPGASALLAALTPSGLVANHFTYLGFLPRTAAGVEAVLRPVIALPHPLVLFEAPHRLVRTLERLQSSLGDRTAVVGRELTKIHEEFRRGDLSSLRAHFQAVPPRGEMVLIVAGFTQASATTPADPGPLVAAALAAGLTPSQAARHVAQQLGLPRQEIYQLALSLRIAMQGLPTPPPKPVQ